MTAIVVTDQAAGTAGMTLVERREPPAAINDVIVQIHASGLVPTEMAWPSTWVDRANRDRTPSIPGHELAGVVTAFVVSLFLALWPQPLLQLPQEMQPVRRGPTPPKKGSSASTPGVPK
jgi:hypothetical protein